VEKLGRARIVANENTAHALCTDRISFSGNNPILQPEVSSTDTTSNTAENQNLLNLQKAHLPTKRLQKKNDQNSTPKIEITLTVFCRFLISPNVFM
jgi:hypothetical protein